MTSPYKLLERLQKQLQQVNPEQVDLLATSLLNNAARKKDEQKLSQIHLALGYHYFNQNLLNSAEREFTLAKQHAETIMDEYLLGRALLGLAAARGEKGLIEEAIQLSENSRFYLQKSEQWKLIPATYFNIGESYLKLGKINEAINSLEQAIQSAQMVKRTDLVLKSMNLISKSRFLMGEYKLALEDLSQAIYFADSYKMEAERIDLRLQFIDLGMRMNLNSSLVMKITREIEQLLEEQERPHLNALLMLSLVYAHTGDLQKALHHFQHLEELITTMSHEIGGPFLLKLERLRAKMTLLNHQEIPSLEERKKQALMIYEGIIDKCKKERINDEDVPLFYLEIAELLLEMDKIDECKKYLQELEIIVASRKQPRLFIQSIMLQYLVCTLQGEKDEANYLKHRVNELMKHYHQEYLEEKIKETLQHAKILKNARKIQEQTPNTLSTDEQLGIVQSYLQEIINEFPLF